MNDKRCSFADGIVAVKPDGRHDLDPCVYEDVEVWRNVTVVVSRCMNCGHIEISWHKQDNTEQIDPDDFEPELGV